MTFFNIIVHGVPDGQKVWSSDPLKQKGYIDAFYQPKSGAPETLFQVEARVEGDERVCYYHYLKCRDIQAKGGRTGSYFGFTLRTDALCADLPLLFYHMDEVFHTAILNTVLTATPNGYKHLVADYAERKNELDTLVKEFNMWLSKPRIKELFGTLPQFPGAKQKSVVLNLEDFSVKQAVLNVLSKGFILCLSPDVPRSAYIAEKKQLQDQLEQKDAEYDKRLQQEKKDTEKKLLQQIATLEENKKKLSAKLTAQNVVEGKLEALKKDMEGLLPYLAIYSATNSSHDGKQQEEYPAEQVIVSETVEKAEDSDIEKEEGEVNFLHFVKKNTAYFRLLCLFVAIIIIIIIAFCFGRYVFPSISSENENAKKEYGIPSQTYGISNRSEEPTGEKTNRSDSNLKKSGEYSSEYKGKQSKGNIGSSSMRSDKPKKDAKKREIESDDESSSSK